jgi:hypothetical protein
MSNQIIANEVRRYRRNGCVMTMAGRLFYLFFNSPPEELRRKDWCNGRMRAFCALLVLSFFPQQLWAPR